MTRRPVSPARCQERVPIPGVWSHDSTCSRAAVRDGYCTQHHPDTVAARRAKRHAEWEARRAADEKRHAARQFGAHAPRFFLALKSIADGHNDPRTVAREAIEGIDPP